MTKDQERVVPRRALVLSLLSLAVPALGSFFFYDWATDEYGLLLWMTALLPAFLLTYYRGWKGASAALALGMAALSMSQVGVTALGIGTPDWALIFVVVLVYIGVCMGIGALAELLHRDRRAAEHMALKDSLTGLPNRRHADVFLEAAVASVERGTPLAVALFDLDHFKRFNDSYGHQAGDEVLQSFARLLDDETRRSNLAARWGGEEFLCVLSDCDREGAEAFVERVSSRLRGLDHPWGRVTTSVGIARYEPTMGSRDVLLAAADRALYRAKALGRDRYVVAGGEVDATPRRSRPKPRREVGPGEGSVPVGEGARRGVRTLLVDDDADVRRALGRLLEQLGHDVVTAEDSASALTVLRDQGPWLDLLVTDVVLPDMNGFSLVEQMTRFRPELPVLYVSGKLHGEVSWPGVPGHDTAFLEKPVEFERLASSVEKLLGDGARVGAARPIRDRARDGSPNLRPGVDGPTSRTGADDPVGVEVSNQPA